MRPNAKAGCDAATADMLAWLRAEVAQALQVAPAALDPDMRFNQYGLDSARAMALAARISKETRRVFPVTLVWRYPTLNALAAHVVKVKVGTAERPAAEGASAPRAAERTAGCDPVAVVGLACRFPGGASTPERFWSLLRDGVDAIRQVPADRWSLDEHFDPDLAAPGKMNTRWGGFLDRVDGFDPFFFGISPREAIQADPQQRLILTLCWEALEDANILPGSLQGSRTGVFVGSMWSDYARLAGEVPDQTNAHSATGQDTSIIAGRVSYTLGLRGPSLVVNTACSSSLVALHLACQSLRAGESSLALVGGVSLVLSPWSTVAMSKFGAMSPEGRCRAFDAKANGYVRGEGGGVVVLKPLSRAILDGDHVYGIVRGSAVNNDGFSNGLTAPSPQAQEEVLRLAYAAAAVEPEEVQYVEAHGPGTALGDPIEAGALGAVLGAARSPERPLRIGSVKSNLGHLEAAAGMAGLIKVLLAMKHRMLPASLHFEQPNPHIPFDEINLRVQRDLTPWPRPDEPLVAGVSSFGFGGTNAHAVLEGPPAPAYLLPLAADSVDGLYRKVVDLMPAAAEMAGWRELESGARQAAQDANGGAARAAFVVRSPEELFERAAARIKQRTAAKRAEKAAAPSPVARPQIAFVFPGHGSQWLGMGRSLLQREPAFRAALLECDRVFRAESGWSVLDELVADAECSRMHEVDVVQPLIFSIQVGLGALWRAWGIEPDVLIGHSMGEIAAAHLAGILTLEDAARVVSARGRLARGAGGRGAMAVVECDPSAAPELVAGQTDLLAVAAYNDPHSVVLSGEGQALERLLAGLEEAGRCVRRVNIAFASHSPQMDELLGPLQEALRTLAPRPSLQGRRMVSTVTQGDLAGPECGAEYWARNLRQPVRFAQVVEQLARERDTIFVELSSHPILVKPIEETLARLGGAGAALPSFRRDADERRAMLESLAALYARGADVRWQGLLPGDRWGQPADAAPGRPVLLTLSAKSGAALAQLAGRYRDLLADPGAAHAPADVAFTASTRRTHHAHRLCVTGAGREALVERLDAFLEEAGRTDASPSVNRDGIAAGTVETGGAPRTVFVFSGQGAQWSGMGRELLEQAPVFRDALQECDAAYRRLGGGSILEELAAGATCSRLHATEIAQPAILAIQVGIVALLRSWGVAPDAVIGHSVGEAAAGWAAGAFELEEALRIVHLRGALMQRAAGQGRMLAVELGPEEAREWTAGLEAQVSIAAVNGPRAVVLAGDTAAVREIGAALKVKGVGCREVRVEYAFHSPHMEPIQGELAAALSGLRPLPGAVPLYSTVTGARACGSALDGAYWARNVRETVRFAEAVEAAAADGGQVFVEVAPSAVLSGNLRDILRGRGAVVGTLRRERGELASMLGALGALHCRGVPVDLGALHPEGGRRVALPAYAWQEERYWLPAAGPRAAAAARPSPETSASLLYRVDWAEVDSGALASAPRPALSGEHWIIVADQGGIGGQLAALAVEHGAGCSVVSPQEPIEPAPATGPSCCAVERFDSRFGAEVPDAAPGAQAVRRRVIFLRALDATPAAACTTASLGQDADRGCGGLAELVKVLSQPGALRPPPPPARIWIVTQGARFLPGDEHPVALAQAPVLGMARSVALEHRELLGAEIDLDPALPPGRSAEELFHAVLAEDGEEQVALRRGARRAARLVRAEAPAGDGVTFHREGTYLVTGGLGALGREVAGWLAARGAGHLVLAGRGAPSPEALETIEALRRRGAGVTVESADVSRPEQVEALLDRIAGTLPPLRGIVHAAGVMGSDGEGRRLQEILAPKVAGAWNLYRATAALPLDFFLLFSSITTIVIPLAESASYAAANSFLDALAHEGRRAGRSVTAIGWGPWAAGMAAHVEGGGGRFAARGFRPIAAPDALAALGALVAGGAPHRYAADVDWREAIRRIYFDRPPALLRELLPAAASTPAGAVDRSNGVGLRQQLEAQPARRQELLQRAVEETACEVLGVARTRRLDPRLGFAAMGMDSLMAVEMRVRLASRLGSELSSTLTFDYPNVEALTAHLAHSLFAAAAPQPPPASLPAAAAALSSQLSIEDLMASLERKLDGIKL